MEEGSSIKNLAQILAAYVALYLFLFVFFCLLLKGAIDTDQKHTLLWTFFYFGAMFCTIVGIWVKFGTQENLKKSTSEIDTDIVLEKEALV